MFSLFIEWMKMECSYNRTWGSLWILEVIDILVLCVKVRVCRITHITAAFPHCIGLAGYKFYTIMIFVQFRSNLTKKFVTVQVFPASAAPKWHDLQTNETWHYIHRRGRVLWCSDISEYCQMFPYCHLWYWHATVSSSDTNGSNDLPKVLMRRNMERQECKDYHSYICSLKNWLVCTTLSLL
jgi:hypothetical protein